MISSSLLPLDSRSRSYHTSHRCYTCKEKRGREVDYEQDGNSELLFLVAPPQPVEEHLLQRFVVTHHDVADGVSADEVADFFRQVLRVVAGALQRLGHEDHLQAGLALQSFWILDVPQEKQIAHAENQEGLQRQASLQVIFM